MKPASSEFFRTACDVFDATSKQAGGTERTFRIAGEPIQFRLVGAEDTYVGRALEHLPALANESPALTIGVWRGTAAGCEMPAPPWTWDAGLGRGEIPGWSSDELPIAYHIVPGVLCMLDMQRGRGLYWIRDGHAPPSHDSSTLLRTVLHWWLAARGRQIAHAAAVGTSDGGVLLAGRSGSGKSTLALACVSAGLGYVSDDSCVVGNDGAPRAWSIFNTAKLDKEAWQRFPELARHLSNPERLDDEKGVLFLHDSHGDQVLDGFPVRGVVVPRIGAGSTSLLRSTSPAMALAALAPSTIAQLPLAGARAFKLLSDLVSRVPCYELELGTKLAHAPSLISRILS